MKFSIRSLASLTVAAVAAASCLPAFAQGYSYNYGGSRVLNQGQTGLIRPSSTYIGPGTMSQSAQGASPQAQQSNNPLLPKVPWGSTVRTPGDNFYQGGAPGKDPTQATKQQQAQAAAARRYQRMRQQRTQQKTYIYNGPGQQTPYNSYGQGQQGQQVQYNQYQRGSGYSQSGNGAASYNNSSKRNY